MWVRDLFMKRNSLGEYKNPVKEMRLADPYLFFKQFRMSSQSFDHLLSLEASKITKNSLRRETLSPAERLCITLH